MKLTKTEMRQLARERNETMFVHICKKHGEAEHYVSSGRCKQCTSQSKDPAKQAAYFKKWYAAQKNDQ